MAETETAIATAEELVFLTPRKVAELLGVSIPTVSNWLHRGDPERRLPAYRPGNGCRIVIPRAGFLAWLEQHRLEGPIEVRATRTHRPGRRPARTAATA